MTSYLILTTVLKYCSKCFVQLQLSAPTISLNNISRSVLAVETAFVLCEVRTDFIHFMKYIEVIRQLKQLLLYCYQTFCNLQHIFANLVTSSQYTACTEYLGGNHQHKVRQKERRSHFYIKE